MSSARVLAAGVLRRVLHEGAFAAAALSAALDRSSLDPRDRGLSTEITYGVLRTQGYLERKLGEFGKLKTSDAELMSHLLVAAYQIEFLDRIPVSAAVNEGVQAISQVRDRRVAGFANAILRRFSERPAEEKLSLPEAARQSAPSWLRRRLTRDLGEEQAFSLLAPRANPTPYLRIVNEEAQESLPGQPGDLEEVTSVPSAYRFIRGGDPRKLSGFEEGRFVVQELGAQLVAHSLGCLPGEAVLDVCAGRGQKTSLLAEQVGAEGRVVATDLHESKVREATETLERLRLKTEHRAHDFTGAPPAEWEGQFRRVLVDAPCTGVGTLARRPEIARRLSAEDPARMSELQTQIAVNAARTLTPGGVLLFATCSVLEEEGERVVEKLVSEAGLEPFCPETAVDDFLFPDGRERKPCFRLLPGVHGTDGYFVARLARRST